MRINISSEKYMGTQTINISHDYVLVNWNNQTNIPPESLLFFNILSIILITIFIFFLIYRKSKSRKDSEGTILFIAFIAGALPTLPMGGIIPFLACIVVFLVWLTQSIGLVESTKTIGYTAFAYILGLSLLNLSSSYGVALSLFVGIIIGTIVHLIIKNIINFFIIKPLSFLVKI